MSSNHLQAQHFAGAETTRRFANTHPAALAFQRRKRVVEAGGDLVVKFPLRSEAVDPVGPLMMFIQRRWVGKEFLFFSPIIMVQWKMAVII